MSAQDLPQSTVTAELLLARLLDLIISCRTIRDASPERVESVLKIKLTPQPDGTLMTRSRLTPLWWHLLCLAPGFFLGPRFAWTMIDSDGGHAAPMTGLGAIDLDRFGTALESAGFDHTELLSEHGRHLGPAFRRGELQVQTLTRRESGEQTATPRLIWSIRVS